VTSGAVVEEWVLERTVCELDGASYTNLFGSDLVHVGVLLTEADWSETAASRLTLVAPEATLTSVTSGVSEDVTSAVTEPETVDRAVNTRLILTSTEISAAISAEATTSACASVLVIDEADAVSSAVAPIVITLFATCTCVAISASAISDISHTGTGRLSIDHTREDADVSISSAVLAERITRYSTEIILERVVVKAVSSREAGLTLITSSVIFADLTTD